MTEYKLEAKLRTDKTNKIRKEGLLPGIVYGHKFDNAKISFDSIVFNHLYREAGTSNLIDIVIDGEKPFKTLINDIQKDPISGKIIHIDFLKVNMKEKIHAEIPLTFVGDSPAVIDLEGSLITPVDKIEVECLPGDLVSEIQVDISILDDFEKNIKVSDLNVPAGVEVLTDPEEIVAFIQEPRSEEELAELEEEVTENVEEIEVEHKGEETPAEGETEAPAAEEKKEE